MERKVYDGTLANKDKEMTMTIDEAYEKAGLNSGYHIMYFIFLVIAHMHSVMVLISLPLLEIFPRVRGCPDLQPSSLCANATTACSRAYTYEDKHYNFMTEYDLICHPYQAALIPTIFALGGLPSGLFAGALSDLFGRWFILTILTIIKLVSLLIIMAVSNYVLLLVFMFVCGFGQALIFGACFSAITDSIHPRNMHAYVTLLNLIFPLGQIVTALIMLSGIRWRILYVIISLYGSLFFLSLGWVREPPRFLFSKARYSEALVNLRHVARFNGRVLPEKLSIRDDGLISQKAPGFTEMRRLMCQCWLLKRFLPLLFMFFVMGYMFGAIIFNIQKFSVTPHLLLIYIGLVQAVIVIVSGFLYRYMGRSLLLISFSLIIISLIVHYFAQHYQVLRDICLIVCILGSGTIVNIVDILAGESFPSAIKNTLFTFLSFVFRIGTPLGPLLGIHYGLVIWFGVGICAAGLIVAILFCFVDLDNTQAAQE